MDSRRMCPHCRAFITNKDRTCPYCGNKIGERAVDRRDPSPIAGLIPAARFNTVLLLTINLMIYLATVVYSMNSGRSEGFGSPDGETLLLFGAKYGPAIHAGQWWRYITAGFLHGGIFHIFMNSWVLFDVGAQVEEIYGPSRMYVIYFAANFLGFMFSEAWSPMALSMGASAAVFGLIGAMIVVGMKHKSAQGEQIRSLYVRWAIWGMVMGFLPGMNIDNAAHIGGLVAGFGVGWIAATPRHEGSPLEKVWKFACICCILITAVSFLEVYLPFLQSAR